MSPPYLVPFLSLPWLTCVALVKRKKNDLKRDRDRCRERKTETQRKKRERQGEEETEREKPSEKEGKERDGRIETPSPSAEPQRVGEGTRPRLPERPLSSEPWTWSRSRERRCESSGRIAGLAASELWFAAGQPASSETFGSK